MAAQFGAAQLGRLGTGQPIFRTIHKHLHKRQAHFDMHNPTVTGEHRRSDDHRLHGRAAWCCRDDWSTWPAGTASGLAARVTRALFRGEGCWIAASAGLARRDGKRARAINGDDPWQWRKADQAGLSVGHSNGFYADLTGLFFAKKVSHSLKSLNCLSPATPASSAFNF
jgi:hypothetical protein